MRTWRVSAIVVTCNNSGLLRMCLASLETQSVPPAEVVIADDGSDPAHVAVIHDLMARSPLPTVYARQEREGYRAAANRNNGARHSTGDYLVFLDGDVVLFPDVLERHLAVARARRWVSGFVVRLTRQESQLVSEDVIRARRLAGLWPAPDDPRCVKLRKGARHFRLNALRAWLWPSERRRRMLNLLGGQASLPREAFERVNGFDEDFQGWGCDDLDLGLRLQLAGVRGHTVEDTSRALHLYHPPAPAVSPNRAYYGRPRHGEYRCRSGFHKEGGGVAP